MSREVDELGKTLNVDMKDTSEVKDDKKHMKLTQEEFTKEIRNAMERQAAHKEDQNRRMSNEMKRKNENRNGLPHTGGQNGKNVSGAIYKTQLNPRHGAK